METAKIETKSQVINTASLWIDVKKARRSKDQQYVIFELEDGRLIRKHVNFLKSILGIAFTPKAKSAQPVVAAQPQVA